MLATRSREHFVPTAAVSFPLPKFARAWMDGPPILARADWPEAPLRSKPSPLASLEGGVSERSGPLWDSLAARFCGWAGASGARYICSVFAGSTPPAFDAAVFLAVACDAAGKRSLVGVGENAQIVARRARMRGEAIAEWHLHFLAGTAEARERICDDLA